MRVTDLLTESRSTPCIVVDVQPAYDRWIRDKKSDIIQFVNKQTGPVLMFINADGTGMTDDTEEEVAYYWEENGFDPDNWDRVEVVDKGYGYFRSYMDEGINPAIIIRLIRALYQEKVYDTSDLSIHELLYIVGYEAFDEFGEQWFREAPFSINWTSVAQLKQFSGAYIMGGSRNECLREVELLMNAFNIRYKRIDRLVY